MDVSSGRLTGGADAEALKGTGAVARDALPIGRDGASHPLHGYDPARSLRCGCGVTLPPRSYQAHVWRRQRFGIFA